MNIRLMLTDLKRLYREPVFMLFMLAPLLLILVFRLGIEFGLPALTTHYNFDFSKYYGYILALVFILSAPVTGTVAGFMMIDDRDDNVFDLMSITPIGYSGYIFNRLMMPFVFSFFYTIIAYFIIALIPLSTINLMFFGVLAGLEAIIIGLLLFKLADNKVKGLTISKGLNVFMLFALVDLLGIGWLSIISGIIPFYWMGHLLTESMTYIKIIVALFVHVGWIYFLLIAINKEI